MTIRTADLFNLATSGIRAQTELLQTTGNNIANINTEGYVRERTVFDGQATGGVGASSTSRVIDLFAQNQLRRDTTQVGEYSVLQQKTAQLDDIVGSEANSIGESLSRYFSALQISADAPTNQSARQLVIAEANSFAGQMNNLSEFLADKDDEINRQLTSLTTEANGYIQVIADLNNQIRITQSSNQLDEPGTLKNEKDLAILKLSELLSISTLEQPDGSTTVFLDTGQALVMQEGTFNVLETNGDPDLTFKNLQLNVSGTNNTMNLSETNVGGEIGGLFRYRNEVLAESQRQLGQIALTFADAMNEQNNLGMDYDGQLGADIFTLPQFTSLDYAGNSNSALGITGRVTEGSAQLLTTSDYRITIDAVGAGPTVDFTVALLNPDGSAKLDSTGTAITQAYTGQTAAVGTFVPILDGLEMEFTSGGAYAVGDQFLIQPTKNTASSLDVAITRPEDLALASPIRIDSNINNLGDATVTSTTVTNTTVDNTFANNAASGFTGAGGIHASAAGPGGVFGAPAQIRFTSATDFQILDDAGLVITTVTGATNLNNLIAQGVASGAGPAWPAAFSALGDYPGYDLSLQGVPQAGDTFTIGFNTNGTDDNRNGIMMGELQDANTMRRDASTAFSDSNAMSFHGGYATMVSEIGEHTRSADIFLKSSEAMQTQSKAWFESVSGVNLDEEAANLVRYQQAYAASARILTAAQSIFDTILSSTR